MGGVFFLRTIPDSVGLQRTPFLLLFAPTLVENNSDTAGSDGIAIVSFNKHFLRKKKQLYIFIIVGS